MRMIGSVLIGIAYDWECSDSYFIFYFMIGVPNVHGVIAR